MKDTLLAPIVRVKDCWAVVVEDELHLFLSDTLDPRDRHNFAVATAIIHALRMAEAELTSVRTIINDNERDVETGLQMMGVHELPEHLRQTFAEPAQELSVDSEPELVPLASPILLSQPHTVQSPRAKGQRSSKRARNWQAVEEGLQSYIDSDDGTRELLHLERCAAQTTLQRAAIFNPTAMVARSANHSLVSTSIILQR